MLDKSARVVTIHPKTESIRQKIPRRRKKTLGAGRT
jgi:hypothetical protein